MMLLVTMITSSAVCANSLMTRYTICRRLASLFWKSFDMPKKSDVASFVGNFSPVNNRSVILVSSIRHFLGEMGEELKTRAMVHKSTSLPVTGFQQQPSWNTDVRSTFTTVPSASSSFLL